MLRLLPATLFALSLTACSSGDKDDEEDEAGGIAALGGGSGAASSIRITTIGDDDDGLDVPRDLAFDPEHEDRLWVVNRDDDSVTIFFDAGTDAQLSQHIVDPYALHFMEEVSSIAFGQPGTFGTCQESRNTYNDNYPANDFMGPTLWSSDLDIFGQTNPEAVDYLSDLFGSYADLGSHLDMLHETPECMGIAWERDNRYWVYDGMDDAIEMNDFNDDHGPGYDDHSDGEIATYAEGELQRVEDVPSHLELDHDSLLLYVADTGNNRVAVLDTTSGEAADSRRVSEPGTDYYYVDDADLWTLIDGDDVGMEAPSGLALHDGVLYVTDNETSTIFAFDIEGRLLDSVKLDVDEGGLMGIEVRGADDIWVVDAEDDKVLRLQPGG